MVLYFSGTGNSKFVAKLIAKETGDTLVSLNDFIKENSCSSHGASPQKAFSSEKPFVFVTPTYASRIPHIISTFIENHQFNGNKKAYFVMTAFASIGCAEKYNEKLCTSSGLEYKGTAAILMAENYVAMFDIPSQKEAEQYAERAIPSIEAVAHDIAAEKTIAPVKSATSDVLMSTVVNPLFYKMFVHANGFHVTDKCIHCGACAVNCPLNNITLVEGRPVWGKDCTHCMSCICRCPQQAIEYKNATQNRERFFIEG